MFNEIIPCVQYYQYSLISDSDTILFTHQHPAHLPCVEADIVDK